MSKKTIFTIILLVIVLAVIAFFAYFFFVVKKENPDATITDAFPFGRSPDPIDIDLSDDEEDLDRPPLITQQTIPPLRQIHPDPTAGGISFQEGGETVVRYITRAGGEVFETTTQTTETDKVAETEIPVVYEAHWLNRGSFVIRTLRSDFQTIESIHVEIKEDSSGPFFFNTNLEQGDAGSAVLELQKLLNKDPETEVASTGPGSFGSETINFGPATQAAVVKFQEKYSSEILEPQNLEQGTGVVDSLTRDKLNELSGWSDWQNGDDLLETEGKVLDLNILELAVSKDGDRVFYLKEGEEYGSRGYVLNTQQGTETLVFESPLREWLVEWPSPNRVSLTTKPSNGVNGFSFLLNTSTGVTERILGNIEGLTSLVNNDSSKALYSRIDRNNWDLNIRDLATNSSLSLPGLRTLPEKCVWSELDINIVYCAIPASAQGRNFPDAWYQGVEFFSDGVWKIDAETGTSTLIEVLATPGGETLDATRPFLDPDEEFFFFINKKDLSLWSLNLKNEPVVIGDPEE